MNPKKPLSLAFCLFLILPGGVPASHAATVTAAAGAPNPGAGAAGAGVLGSYFSAHPDLLGGMSFAMDMPETAALVRLLGPLPAFSPEALAGRPLTQADIQSAVLELARGENVFAQNTVANRGEGAPTTELWKAHEQLEDLLALSGKIPGLDAGEIEGSRKALETVLAERPEAHAARIPRHPSFDGSKAARAADAAGAEVDAGHVAAVHARRPSLSRPDEHGAAARREGPKALLDPVIVHSELASVDDSFEHFVTHSRPGKKGTDPIQLTVDFIDDYIAYKGMPDSEKHLVLKYFEIGHPRVVEAIERATRANIRTTILTDFNQSMVGAFPGNELHNTDFENGTYKNSEPGKSLRYLRETLGFKLKLGEGLFTVLSGVPLFNPRDKGEKPLMHDKGVFAAGPNGRAYELSLNGSANMNLSEDKSKGALPAFGGRFNSLQLVKDPAATQVDWEQVNAEMDAFNRRNFKDIKRPRNPVRVVYKDGTYREILFTNGVQNPNDRIVDLFRRAADPKNNIKIDEVVYSHFVLTHTDQVEALRKLMDAQRDFKVFGVFDQQFIWLDGFGEAGALAQFLVQRPMGKSIFPYRSEYESRMELYGYQRLLDNAKKIDLEGAPIWMHLWHDKTTMVKTKELDPTTGQWVEYTYVFTRSFNDSGHYQSYESQDMYRFRRDSPKAKEIEDGIKEVAKAEPQYAVDLSRAIVRDWLARHTQHTPYDIDVAQYVVTMIDALTRQDYAHVESLLSEIGGLATRHTKKIDLAKVREHIAKFIHFLNWYAGEAASDRSLNKMTYRKAVNLGVAIANGENPWKMKTALDILYFNARRPREETLRLEQRAWTEGLQMTAPFPGSGRTGGSPDSTPVAAAPGGAA